MSKQARRQSHARASTIMLVRVLGSIFGGITAFVLALVFQIRYLVGKVIPLQPQRHPGESGMDRLPPMIFWIALLVAVAVGIGIVLATRRLSRPVR